MTDEKLVKIECYVTADVRRRLAIVESIVRHQAPPGTQVALRDVLGWLTYVEPLATTIGQLAAIMRGEENGSEE